MLRLLWCVAGVLVASYGTFVTMSILNVIARSEALAEVTRTRSAVGEFERDYFALSSEITQSNGIALHLSPVSKVDYVHRPGAVGAASSVRNEI